EGFRGSGFSCPGRFCSRVWMSRVPVPAVPQRVLRPGIPQAAVPVPSGYRESIPSKRRVPWVTFPCCPGSGNGRFLSLHGRIRLVRAPGTVPACLIATFGCHFPFIVLLGILDGLALGVIVSLGTARFLRHLTRLRW